MQLDDIPDILNWTTGETLARHLPGGDTIVMPTQSADELQSSSIGSSTTSQQDTRPPRLRRSRLQRAIITTSPPASGKTPPAIDTDLYSQYFYVFDNEDDHGTAFYYET
jgi:hypothetical protein